MGFCEMIYHETRKFPPEEKDGITRELRSAAITFLREITIQSVKPQKEFLKALDDTTTIQLDILLLIKLAFRMGFMDERSYQTLEEDLKEFEAIINNMKNMHGMPTSSKTIHQKMPATEEKHPTTPLPAPPVMQKVKEKEKEKEKKPEEVKKEDKKPEPSKREVSKAEKLPKVFGRRSRRSRAAKSHLDKPRTSENDEKSTEPKQPPTKQEPDKSEKSSQHPDNFKGTPLFEDSSSNDSKLRVDKSVINEDNEKYNLVNTEMNAIKPQPKGLWSLKRHGASKSSQENPPPEDPDGKPEKKK